MEHKNRDEVIFFSKYDLSLPSYIKKVSQLLKNYTKISSLH